MQNALSVQLDRRIENATLAARDRLARTKWQVTDEEAEAILLDDQVDHAYNQLVGGITSNDWTISHPDPRVSEFGEHILESVVPGKHVGGSIQDLIRTLCKAVILGRVHINLQWDWSEKYRGAYTPQGYYRIPNNKTRLNPTTGALEFIELGVTTPLESTDRATARQLRRWVMTVPYGSDGHPFGDPIARKIWWIVQMRRDNGMSNWAVGMERFSMPVIQGKLAGNPTVEQLDEFRAALEELRNQFVIALKEGDDVSAIDTAGTWNPAAFQIFMLYLDRQIDKAILGQPGTSGDRGETGTFAETKVHATVRLDIIRAVSTWASAAISCMLNDVLTFPVNQLIFPTREPLKFQIIVPDSSFTTRATNLQWGYDRGLELDRAEFYDTLQITDPSPVNGAVIKKPADAPNPLAFPGLSKGSDGVVHLARGRGGNPKTVMEWTEGAGDAHAAANPNAYDAINKRIQAGLDAVQKAGLGKDAATTFANAANSAKVGDSLIGPLSNGMTQGTLVGRAGVNASREVSRDDPLTGDPTAGVTRSQRVMGLLEANGQGSYFIPPAEIAQIFNDPLIVTRDQFLATVQRSRRWAFFVQEAESKAAVKATSEIIADAFNQGLTFKDVRAQLEETLGEGFSKARLETIFRTNIAQAQHVGTYSRQMDPDVLAATANWVYVNPSDHRSRATHRAMNGYAAPPNTGAWKEWYPPAGYNCRCGVMTQWADEPGLKKAAKWPTLAGIEVHPDEGFGKNVAALLLGGDFKEAV